jgi:isopenicillin N synthase-like dioxygenase
MTKIPVIDLSNPNESDLSEEINIACKNIGFFIVKNHGIKTTTINEMFLEAENFFNLPIHAKEKYKPNGENDRGYSPLLSETLDPHKQSIGDTKECFAIGFEAEINLPFYSSNIWPNECHNFKRVMTNYFDDLMKLGKRLVTLISQSLGLEKTFFDKYFSSPVALLKLLKYCKDIKSCPENGIFAAGEHTDYGMITILATNGVEGLEVWDSQENKWLRVTLDSDEHFIINLGDMLMRWTNDTYVSTRHRVIWDGADESKTRFSAPFFYDPNFDAKIECLDSFKCTSEAKYPPVISGEYLLSKYAATYYL